MIWNVFKIKPYFMFFIAIAVTVIGFSNLAKATTLELLSSECEQIKDLKSCEYTFKTSDDLEFSDLKMESDKHYKTFLDEELDGKKKTPHAYRMAVKKSCSGEDQMYADSIMFSTKEGNVTLISLPSVSKLYIGGSLDVTFKTSKDNVHTMLFIDSSTLMNKNRVLQKNIATTISDSFEINLGGSVDAHLEIPANKVSLNGGGSTDIFLATSADNVDLKIAGSNDLELVSNGKLSLNTSGASSVEFKSNEKLLTKLNGLNRSCQ